MELAASINAEAAARREGKELIGKKTGGVQEMQSVPVSLLSRKPALCASVLRKMGCLGISEVSVLRGGAISHCMSASGAWIFSCHAVPNTKDTAKWNILP